MSLYPISPTDDWTTKLLRKANRVTPGKRVVRNRSILVNGVKLPDVTEELRYEGKKPSGMYFYGTAIGILTEDDMPSGAVA